MLSCRQVVERSSALLDGELAARERLAMRMHLLMCVHCRRFQRHLQRLVTAMRNRDASDPVDQAFIDRLVERLDKTSIEREGHPGPPSSSQ